MTHPLPREIFAYADVAVERPVGAGAVAHRAASYLIDVAQGVTKMRRGAAVDVKRTTVVAPKCHPAPKDGETPTTACSHMSASWADHLGAVACPTCFPPSKPRRRKAAADA
jgi:transposase